LQKISIFMGDKKIGAVQKPLHVIDWYSCFFYSCLSRLIIKLNKVTAKAAVATIAEMLSRVVMPATGTCPALSKEGATSDAAAESPSVFGAFGAAPGGETDTVLPALLLRIFNPLPVLPAFVSGCGGVIVTVELEGVIPSAEAASGLTGSFCKEILAPELGGRIAPGVTLTVAPAVAGGGTCAVCPLFAAGGGVAMVLPLVAEGRIFSPLPPLLVEEEGKAGAAGAVSTGGGVWGAGAGG